VTTFDYDCVGNLVGTTVPLERVTTSSYDALNRPSSTTLPDPDGAGAGLAPWTVFAFDKAGNVLSETDRLGNATTYGYDNLNRLTSETDANGDGTRRSAESLGGRPPQSR
jgi:YD repeat-containing protein